MILGLLFSNESDYHQKIALTRQTHYGKRVENARQNRATGAVAILFLAFVFLFQGTVWANLRYARKTHKPCGFCHVKAAGGGALTEKGLDFRDSGYTLPESEKRKGSLLGPAVITCGGGMMLLTIVACLLILRKRRTQVGTPSSDQPRRR